MNDERKIGVLHLRDSPWVDGPGRTILETGTRIDVKIFKYAIGAFCRKEQRVNAFVKAAKNRNLNVFCLDERHGFDVAVLFRVIQLINRERIDIIHAHEVRSDVIGLLAGKMTGIPVLTTLHGWIENSCRGKIFTRLDKRILRHFDHVIAVSEKMKGQVLECGVKESRVTVLHNALVLEDYSRDRGDRRFRAELGVSNETLLVANIGRLSPEKGQADFIRAARKVLERNQDAIFLLVGVGSDRPQLEALVQHMALKGKVQFLGFRNDMMSIYNSLDLVVQSSLTEGMPNVVLEALAMKVPIIATDVGGTAEALKHRETGILVPPGYPDILAERILEYQSNKNAFAEMADNGRKYMQKRFCMNERTRKLSDIYASVHLSRSKKGEK